MKGVNDRGKYMLSHIPSSLVGNDLRAEGESGAESCLLRADQDRE